jgi:uncharacterized protein YaaQ
MDVFPKFIIEVDDEIGKVMIVAKCTFHKQLAYDVKKVIGGGSWIKQDDTFFLSGRSDDFGEAKIEDIKECVQNNKVFSNYSHFKNMTNKYKFKFMKGGEVIDL